MKKIIFILTLALISSTGYAQWSKIISFTSPSVNDIFISGNAVYTAANNGIYRSTDGTATWQQLNNGLNNSIATRCRQIIQVGDVLYTSTDDGIYKSTDFAASWIRKSDGILIGSGSNFISAQSIYELNGALFTGTHTGIYRSTNAGESWLQTNIFGTYILAKNFTLHNGILFAARESINNPIGYKSTNNGLTWNDLTGLSFFSTITFLSEPGKLFAGTIHGAWLSTNNGVNWIERSTGLNSDPYNSSFIRVNGVLVSSLKFGGSGIFKSTNDGILWTNFGEGLPFLVSIDKIIIFNNKILAATSAGIYQRNTSEVTEVTQISSEIPDEFSLKQNHPNPFNPVTNIKFELPEDSYTSLKIYNSLGKVIAIPVNRKLSKGSYNYNWDASIHASGVYFYTIESGNYKQTKKMVLIK